MRFLQRSFTVRTRYGGGFVQAINGLTGGREGGRPVDWFFYVNGIEAPQGAAATRLHPGDRVWWDRHDWGTAMAVPAVVGSYPEPFRSGTGGRRVPTTVTCAQASGAPCDEVKRRLQSEGVKVAGGVIGTPSGAETIRVLVGPWSDLRRDGVAGAIDRGPQTSGVFARFQSDGRLAVLDARGATTRALGPATGLVAATRSRDAKPTWVVTGTDARGILSAARSLDARTLANHFALAVTPGGEVALPEAAP
jgi:hypothetical protein